MLLDRSCSGCSPRLIFTCLTILILNACSTREKKSTSPLSSSTTTLCRTDEHDVMVVKKPQPRKQGHLHTANTTSSNPTSFAPHAFPDDALDPFLSISSSMECHASRSSPSLQLLFELPNTSEQSTTILSFSTPIGHFVQRPFPSKRTTARRHSVGDLYILLYLF